MDGRVDGVALGHAAHHLVARVDVGQLSRAAVEGVDGALVAGGGDAVVHVAADVGEAGEVAVDDVFGFLARYVEPLGQSECRYAVDDAEVGGLGLAAHVGCDVGGRHSEYACGGGLVDVLAPAEGFDQMGVVAEVRHQPQFDLRIVGGHQHVVARGHEGFAQFASLRVAHGDVLQVGVAAAQASGDHHGLVERRVDVTGLGIYQTG